MLILESDIGESDHGDYWGVYIFLILESLWYDTISLSHISIINVTDIGETDNISLSDVSIINTTDIGETDIGKSEISLLNRLI